MLDNNRRRRRTPAEIFERHFRQRLLFHVPQMNPLDFERGDRSQFAVDNRRHCSFQLQSAKLGLIEQLLHLD